MSAKEPIKTPGQPNICQVDTCVGCEFINRCKPTILANPENVIEAKKQVHYYSMGSIAYDRSGFQD
jgi:hypothetical protein